MTLADPNFAFFLALIGLWATIFAVYKPGTAVFEPLAMLGLIGAILSLAPQQTNWLAATVLACGVLVFLLVPLVRRNPLPIVVGGAAAQIVGALLLFEGAMVSPILIALAVAVTLAIHFYILVPLLRKQAQEPVVGDEFLLSGATGVVVKALDPIGTVNVKGELWTAYSNVTIPTGESVLVVEKDGLRLFVEHTKPKHKPGQQTPVDRLGVDNGVEKQKSEEKE